MRNLIIATMIIQVVTSAANAWGMVGRAHVECVNGEHVVTISGWYNEEFHGEIAGLTLQREAIGICQAADFLPDGLLPFDPQPSPDFFPSYEATVTIVPPLAGVAYRYTPLGVRPDGTLVTLYHDCGTDYRSYALAGCDSAPFARGEAAIEEYATGLLEIRVAPCETDCWTEFVYAFMYTADFESLAGEPWTELNGQTVDVFGARTYCAMAGGDSHIITGFERAPHGVCGPVPVQNTSWGNLKAFYR